LKANNLLRSILKTKPNQWP